MAEFIKDGNKVKMIFGVEDVYSNTANFKNHRDYIVWFFRQRGYEIIKWNWDMNYLTGKWEKFPDGISFMSTDSQFDLRIEVTGEIGKNIREIHNATDSDSTKLHSI